MASRPKRKLERDLQMVAIPPEPPTKTSALPPLPLTSTSAAGAESNALVEYKKGTGLKEDDEDLEVKLRRIIDHVPVRVSNTSGSSAGSGSGDFHQYRQMRRKEQDRLARMDVDYQKRKEIAEFSMRREERKKAAEERTAKKRLKRQKKKQRKKEKKNQMTAQGDENPKGESSNDEDSDDEEELK